jgi:hypothetical protein
MRSTSHVCCSTKQHQRREPLVKNATRDGSGQDSTWPMAGHHHQACPRLGNGLENGLCWIAEPDL